MAIAWQNKATGHHCSVWQNDNQESWGMILKISYLFLQQLDLILTLFAAHLGLSELNPFMKGLLDTPVQLIIIKLIIPILIAWFVPSKFIIPGIAVLFMVVSWNIKELLIILL